MHHLSMVSFLDELGNIEKEAGIGKSLGVLGLAGGLGVGGAAAGSNALKASRAAHAVQQGGHSITVAKGANMMPKPPLRMGGTQMADPDVVNAMRGL